ncbi:MAG: glpK [Massilia sp.]|nr:glpK [Massilia sp.]
MQFQADLLGVPVVRPEVTETTALGAAYLAGLAIGFWESREEIAGQWRAERQFNPAMSADRLEGLLATWARAVERSRGWAVGLLGSDPLGRRGRRVPWCAASRTHSATSPPPRLGSRPRRVRPRRVRPRC